MLIRQGMPLQQVAELLETSYDVVYRLAKSEGIELPRAERKLTPEQLREAYGLLGADVPFRQVENALESILSPFGGWRSGMALS